MSDGGNLGVSATTALNAVLGGQQPTEDDITTKEATRDRIVAQFADPSTVYPSGDWVNASDGGDSYARGADYLAGAVLAYFTAHPEAKEWPVDQEYERGEDGRLLYRDGNLVPVGPDLYRAVKESVTDPIGQRVFSDCTGFMWGWAVNAARWVSDLPPVPNPAILTIGEKTT